ncbi:MAG: hypothetical protein EVJ48_00640 [Candidatus Acidulodesulfobacterium acidiphilum]|uniref:Cytochrome c-552/4 domain-containing protein n=1 Tax=Candidatus Acidulodesulfobacterium acidiphilum TaxID=2597224 RepID=A0A520XGY3_9DELT|nr:MAG: hypothetical protein EVJ48_00640 [Candidatus Acidulodesulfobacterium acidiphilum]
MKFEKYKSLHALQGIFRFKRLKNSALYLPIILIPLLFASVIFLTIYVYAKVNVRNQNADKKYLYLKKLAAHKNTHKFLNIYWKTPIDEGKPPYKWPEIQKSLSPSSCMACHYDQYEEWKNSRMAHSMDAGVVAQLLLKKMTSKHWKPWVESCMSCHSPIGEYYVEHGGYKGLTAKEKNILKNGSKAQKAMVVALNMLKIPMGRGALSVSCAACHVRYYRRFGPGVKKYMKEGNIVHGGFVPSNAFNHSFFCIKCHQFGHDQRRLDGKLFENTYSEWKRSIYAKKGISCEVCHNPQGSMAFKSIYNKNFVLKAVTIRFKIIHINSGNVHAILSLKNSEVGHDFPTYTTPKVILYIGQENFEKEIYQKTVESYIIGWSVSLNLKKQYFDTRLKPFQTAKLIYDRPLVKAAKYLKAWVVVEPESHYVRFFKAFLKIKRLPKIIKTLMSEALKQDLDSKYILWKKQIKLN